MRIGLFICVLVWAFCAQGQTQLAKSVGAKGQLTNGSGNIGQIAGGLPTTNAPLDSFFVNLDTTKTCSSCTNMTGDPHLNVKSVTVGIHSSITVTSTATGNWLPYSGGCAYPNNGLASPYTNTVFNYALATFAESWYSYGASNQDTFKASSPKFTITGLAPGSVWTITISGTQQYNFADSTEYRVIGSNTLGPVGSEAVFACQNNSTHKQIFTGCVADGTGKLLIYVNQQKGQVLGVVCAFKAKQTG